MLSKIFYGPMSIIQKEPVAQYVVICPKPIILLSRRTDGNDVAFFSLNFNKKWLRRKKCKETGIKYDVNYFITTED